MNIVDAIRIQHFKAESQQRRISSIFFLQNCARYFQQQDDLHSWFTLCYAHHVDWQYIFISYLLQHCARRYFQQQDEGHFCLLFVMLTRWVGNICTAPQRITNRGRLLSTQGAKRIMPKCNNKRKNRQRVSL